MLQRVVRYKLGRHFSYVKLLSGGYIFVLRYNPFLLRLAGAGLKISKLDFKKLILDRSGLVVLKAFRRVDRLLYRKQTITAEIQFNVLANTARLQTSPCLDSSSLVRYRRTTNFQVLALRGLVLRNLATVFCALRGGTGFYVTSVALFNTAFVRRLVSFGRG